MNETFTVAPGGQVNSYQPHGFQAIYGIRVDNFSGGWLGIEQQNLWVPPYTRGWKADVYPSMSSISVRSYDFANGTLITGATGQNAVVTIWDNEIDDNEGISFFDEQTVPKVAIQSLLMVNSTASAVLVPAPVMGRIRIYGIYLNYDLDTILTTSEPVSALFTSGALVNFAILDIAPAAPSSFQILAAPGGDMPLTTALQVVVITDLSDPPDNNTMVDVLVRYAII